MITVETQNKRSYIPNFYCHLFEANQEHIWDAKLEPSNVSHYKQ